MKRLVFFTLIVVFIGVSAFSQTAGSAMFVAAKTVSVKSSTGIFARTMASLKMGDKVTLLRVNGKYAEVRTQGNVSGWTALAGLSSKVIVGSGVSASAREVSLAGKGFNSETEIEYKKSGLNYSVVDQMENIDVADNDLLKFIEDGRLNKGE